MANGLSISNAPALRELTTIRLGGTPLARVIVEEPRGFDALPEALARLGGKPVVLGRGSNILAADGELPLVLVELGDSFVSRQPEVLSEDDNSVTLRVGAATPLQLFIKRLAALGLGGLAGLAGIPGQVGGALAMNAGSYGDTIGDALGNLTLFSPALGQVTLSLDELDVSYRHFSIPALGGNEYAPADGSTLLEKHKPQPALNWFVIESAEFCCPRQPVAELEGKMRDSLEKKRAGQPLGSSSAGCVFKNPELAPAGKLLDEAGLKGMSRGGMSFSTLHANFMINEGNGESTQAFELIDEAKLRVREKFGVELELEVRVWA